MAADQRSRGRKVLLGSLTAYLAVVAVYSVVPAGTPGTGLIGILPGRDKAAHALASAGLALLLCCALSADRRSAAAAAGLAIILAWAYALILELVQAFLPWRTCSLGDLAASLAGILFAVGGWAAVRRLVVGQRTQL
jgi:VanZ family protein